MRILSYHRRTHNLRGIRRRFSYSYKGSWRSWECYCFRDKFGAFCIIWHLVKCLSLPEEAAGATLNSLWQFQCDYLWVYSHFQNCAEGWYVWQWIPQIFRRWMSQNETELIWLNASRNFHTFTLANISPIYFHPKCPGPSPRNRPATRFQARRPFCNLHPLTLHQKPGKCLLPWDICSWIMKILIFNTIHIIYFPFIVPQSICYTFQLSSILGSFFFSFFLKLNSYMCIVEKFIRWQRKILSRMKTKQLATNW